MSTENKHPNQIKNVRNATIRRRVFFLDSRHVGLAPTRDIPALVIVRLSLLVINLLLCPGVLADSVGPRVGLRAREALYWNCQPLISVNQYENVRKEKYMDSVNGRKDRLT